MAEKMERAFMTKLRRKVLSVLAGRAPNAPMNAHAIGADIGGTPATSGGRKAYDALVRMEPFGWVERDGTQAGHWVHWRITPAGRLALEQHHDR